MRKGFVFDASLCVSCQACNAACTLENGFQPGTRSIFTWNDSALPLLRVINLSLACNHCAKPACAEACPAKAYTIEASGAVIHHADRCMGCGYCTWQCPYDAPAINKTLGYIEKCHMCYARAAENVDPACVTACPTGALKIVEQQDFEPVGVAWFPETGIGPSIVIKGTDTLNAPLIIPAEPIEDEEEGETLLSGHDTKWLLKEWSLIAFSLLVTAASAILIIYALNSAGGGVRAIPFILMTGAMAVSLVHLGVPRRSWRAVINIISSPLSREIAMVALLTILALLHWISPGLIPPVITGAIALITLISIDLVYFNADRTTALKLHSGQAFFSGIYAVSWFIEPRTIFLVFSMLAAVPVVIRYRTAEKGRAVSNLYYFRAMALPVVFMLIYPGSPVTDIAALVLFLAGIVADRVLSFNDFIPINIKNTISEHFINKYEKERDKQHQDSGLS